MITGGKTAGLDSYLMSIVILTKEKNLEISGNDKLVASMLEVCIPVAFLHKRLHPHSFSANLEVKMGTSKLLIEET